jgi:hypothetical protein
VVTPPRGSRPQAGDDDLDEVGGAALPRGRDAADDEGLEVLDRDVRANGPALLRLVQQFGEGGVERGFGLRGNLVAGGGRRRLLWTISQEATGVSYPFRIAPRWWRMSPASAPG